MYFDCHIRELIPLCALNDIVQHKDGAVIAGLEDEDILVFALLVVKNLVDFEGHGLAGPHVRDLAEPAICLILCQYAAIDV
jgi:hypothetical protein